MNGTIAVLRTLHHGELALQQDLLAAADRHRPEAELPRAARDLADWSGEHARLIADTAADRGLELPAPPEPAPLTRLRRRAAEDFAPRPAPELALLDDLCALHLAATRNSLHWEMLTQAARTTRDSALLDLADRCHPQTLQQMDWTTTMVRTLAPQLLTAE